MQPTSLSKDEDLLKKPPRKDFTRKIKKINIDNTPQNIPIVYPDITFIFDWKHKNVTRIDNTGSTYLKNSDLERFLKKYL